MHAQGPICFLSPDYNPLVYPWFYSKERYLWYKLSAIINKHKLTRQWSHKLIYRTKLLQRWRLTGLKASNNKPICIQRDPNPNPNPIIYDLIYIYRHCDTTGMAPKENFTVTQREGYCDTSRTLLWHKENVTVTRSTLLWHKENVTVTQRERNCDQKNVTVTQRTLLWPKESCAKKRSLHIQIVKLDMAHKEACDISDLTTMIQRILHKGRKPPPQPPIHRG